jgi:hypothetical protein
MAQPVQYPVAMEGFPTAMYVARVPKDFPYYIRSQVRADSSNDYFVMMDALREVLRKATALAVRIHGCTEEIWNFRAASKIKYLMKMSKLQKKIADDPDVFFTHIVERGAPAHINIYTGWLPNDLKDLFVIHIKYDLAAGGTFTFEYSCNNLELAVKYQ